MKLENERGRRLPTNPTIDRGATFSGAVFGAYKPLHGVKCAAEGVSGVVLLSVDFKWEMGAESRPM